MKTSFPTVLAAILCVYVFTSCGGGSSTPSPNGSGNGNPLPTVTSISPSSATAGGVSFTLTVTGTNFVSGSIVNWASTPLTTSFVSSTSVMASVPAANLSSAGTTQVTVANPAPGGGTSAAKTFSVNNPAPAVTALSQTSADVGSDDISLMVSGTDFVSTSVVKWNGSARATSFGSSTDLTVTIPASDLAFSGSAQVSVSNPTPGGGNSSGLTFTINPQIANGNGLPGDPAALAIDATADVPAVDVDVTDVENRVIMNRLALRFAKDATVGQVNDALASVGGGIVSMSQGIPLVSIGIPRQSSVAALRVLAKHLEAFPGVRIVTIAALLQPQSIFNGSGQSAVETIIHLLPSRFPAAWNAAPLDKFGDPSHPQNRACPTNPVPVLMDDFFPMEFASSFLTSFPSFEPPDAPAPGFFASDLEHGITTTTIVAANSIGANPFPFSGCVDLHLVQLAAFRDINLTVDDLVEHMPQQGRFIVNYSAGFKQTCSNTPCKPPFDTLPDALSFANAALHWKEMTRNRWSDFLMVVSAGNDRDDESSGIYPGMADSRFQSHAAISQLADTGFQFVSDDNLWSPSPEFLAQGFDSLKPTASEQAQLELAIADANMSGPDSIADNVIVVGSLIGQTNETILTQHITGDILPESAFSERHPDVLAVGENVFNTGMNGTSFSAPQVTGLASFLWMLSPDLRNNQPIARTKHAIVDNARNQALDAYASVLSLDQSTLPMPATAPIRMNLLDIDGISGFTEGDIDLFLRAYFEQDSQGNITDQPVAPTEPDFSFLDLNGDGFTGGSGTERFDLDREGSTQYGATVYSTVLQNIGGDVAFDETRLTDLQILCYYAYSGLYTGDDTARESLLAGRCNPVTVTIDPGQASLANGNVQQFSATVRGTSDPRVTWTTTGSGNTIDSTGLFHAGSNSGTFTVRATSVADPKAFGEAMVTIASQACNLPSFDSLSNVGLFFVNHGQTKDLELNNQPGSLSGDLPGQDGSASGSAGQGFFSFAASDPDTSRDSNGGGVQVQGDFSDWMVINPANPALLGQQVTATVPVQVAAHPQVSGANAAVSWSLSMLSFDTSPAMTGDMSVGHPSHGDPSGNTYTLAKKVVLGEAFQITANFTISVGFGTVPPPGQAPGAASMNVDVHWQGFSSVTDLNGNPVPFSVCSFTGTNWANSQ